MTILKIRFSLTTYKSWSLRKTAKMGTFGSTNFLDTTKNLRSFLFSKAVILLRLSETLENPIWEIKKNTFKLMP